jgi:hypothetical protein
MNRTWDRKKEKKKREETNGVYKGRPQHMMHSMHRRFIGQGDTSIPLTWVYAFYDCHECAYCPRSETEKRGIVCSFSILASLIEIHREEKIGS